MLKRLPLIPTLLVLIAVAVMVRMGLWQLDRLHQKEALLAEYAAVQRNGEVASWPEQSLDHGESRAILAYHRVRGNCAEVLRIAPMAGENDKGESGWRHIAHCRMASGYNRGEVVLGWSREPRSPIWAGGDVEGTFLMTGQYAARIVADPPLAGLQANAKPDPNDIPNNHLSYAFQWFAFALTALVIYALALRKRLAAGAEGG